MQLYPHTMNNKTEWYKTKQVLEAYQLVKRFQIKWDHFTYCKADFNRLTEVKPSDIWDYSMALWHAQKRQILLPRVRRQNEQTACKGVLSFRFLWTTEALYSSTNELNQFSTSQFFKKKQFVSVVPHMLIGVRGVGVRAFGNRLVRAVSTLRLEGVGFTVCTHTGDHRSLS